MTGQGIKEHKLIREVEDMLDDIGNIDISAYVNFQAIKQIAKQNKNSNLFPLIAL